jgi:hypothetical protein
MVPLLIGDYRGQVTFASATRISAVGRYLQRQAPARVYEHDMELQTAG